MLEVVQALANIDQLEFTGEQTRQERRSFADMIDVEMDERTEGGQTDELEQLLVGHVAETADRRLECLVVLGVRALTVRTDLHERAADDASADLSHHRFEGHQIGHVENAVRDDH